MEDLEQEGFNIFKDTKYRGRYLSATIPSGIPS